VNIRSKTLINLILIKSFRLIVSDPLADFSKPTLAATQALLDNYQHDVTVQDELTGQQIAEELAFIDAVMETSVMQQLHTFLISKGNKLISIN
jgi:poly(U)-specific endoribonuclease